MAGTLRSGGWHRRWRQWSGTLFVLPTVALLLVFLVYPIFSTIRLSLDTGIFLQLRRFVGIDNYVNLFTKDRLFFNIGPNGISGVLVNNIEWLVLYTGGCIGFGLLIAALADRVRYETVVKTVVFVPQAIAATATGLIWLLIYAPNGDIGLLNAILKAFGEGPIGFLGSASIVNYALIVAAIWTGTGLAVVILSAAIKSVPAELVEAATIDGASATQAFRSIVLPMISGPLTVVAVTLAIAAIKTFDLVFIMTRGGPNGASGVIGYTYYNQTWEQGRGGYGAAAAIVMLVVVIPIILLNIRRFRASEAAR
jgi:alpha-glucoside transport system permease protein